MKYEFRGQLNNKKMVDIFKFDGEYAICDGKIEKIHIDEFNSIFLPRETFKKLLIKTKKSTKKKVEIVKEEE